MKAMALMTHPVCSIGPRESIARAAQLMGETGIGALTVIDDGKLVGIVTDRDIVIRGIGRAVSPHEPVAQVMSSNVKACAAEAEVEDALALMAEQQIRRMPVCNSYGGVIGMLSLSDIMLHEREESVETLCAICRSSAVHGQVARIF